MTDMPSDMADAADAAGTPPDTANTRTAAPAAETPVLQPHRPRRGARPAAESLQQTHALLDQLAALYPQLFGAQFLPLKRGIFQDLMAAHPGVFEREALKAALGLHTRSTRYLTEVAAGRKRHDLEGSAVEDMAPEHVYQSLLEVFQRRQKRAGEDLRPQLRKRILQAFDASGMAREAYADLVRGRDEAANAVLDEAMAEAAERQAKDEAVVRAFESSGQTVAAFAEMYGLEVPAVSRALERARRQRVAPEPATAS